MQDKTESIFSVVYYQGGSYFNFGFILKQPTIWRSTIKLKDEIFGHRRDFYIPKQEAGTEWEPQDIEPKMCLNVPKG